MNLERARFNMVEQQIRPMGGARSSRAGPDGTGSPRRVRAERVPPPRLRRHRRSHRGRGSDAASQGRGPAPSGIEDRARGTGARDWLRKRNFLTYLLAQCAAHVTGIERKPMLAERGRANLATHGVGNATVEVGDGCRGWEPGAPYDVIAVGGSVPVPEPSFEEQLTIGGRLFIVTGTAPAMEAMLVQRTGEREWVRESLFETVLPPLAGAEAPRRFRSVSTPCVDRTHGEGARRRCVPDGDVRDRDRREPPPGLRARAGERSRIPRHRRGESRRPGDQAAGAGRTPAERQRVGRRGMEREATVRRLPIPQHHLQHRATDLSP